MNLAVDAPPPDDSLEASLSLAIPTLPQSELPSQTQSPSDARAAIRRSLHASTLDGVFAAVFSNATGGAILSGFFLELGASSSQIGLLAAIPMLANLLQPLGAYISELTTSRHLYCLWIYGVSRSLWLFLALAIGWTTWQHGNLHWLLLGTLVVAAASHLLGALGSAAWMSWMAVLVPRRIRGRYFGFRNSAANLTNLIAMPLMGLLISHWYGGSIQGYGVVLGLGIVAGIISLAFQGFMVDVNPQVQHNLAATPTTLDEVTSTSTRTSLIAFLVFFTGWTFAFNLSAPFYNLYLFNALHLDISLVMLYNSLSAGANLALLMLWGKLADRFGNRPILLSMGILMAVLPLLWLGTGATPWSIWVWFPLLHIFSGAIWAGVDLCSSNLQIGIAPVQKQSAYFGLVAALAGISGAFGTIAGGFLAEIDLIGGVLGLFALSSILRLISLLPLVFVQERHGQPLSQLMRMLFPKVEATEQKLTGI
ncbi:MAG: MFS transporter [Elainella sp. C42_A2020_010]|nr:MFS transporter [Elainella sp. C42_A2020_010]